MTKKMRVPGLLLAIALFLSSAVPTVTHAQKSAPPAGVDDADFAAFVKMATTRPEFLSPLVDHLPKKAGVPSPKDVLGYHIGTEKKLTYVADQQRYFRALEKALPGRVKTEVIGKTEEGRDVMVVYVTSEANLRASTRSEGTRSLPIRAGSPTLRRTADRDDQAALSHQRQPPQRGNQSTRSGDRAAYKSRRERRTYIKQIRDNVIVSITGAPTSTDAIATSTGIAYKIDELRAEKLQRVPYWGKYVSTTTTRHQLRRDSLPASIGI